MEKIKTRSIAIITATLMSAAVILWIILMLLGVGKKETVKTPGILSANTNTVVYSISTDSRKDSIDIFKYGKLYFPKGKM